MDDNTTIINPEFTYRFADKDYTLKKANLKLVIAWQQKVQEIQTDGLGARDTRMGAYAIYLVLHAKDELITEDYVLENAPGELDVMETLATLGFMSQQQVEATRNIKDSLVSLALKTTSPSAGDESLPS